MSLGKIPLPNEWMGKKIEGSIEKVLSGKGNEQEETPRENVQVDTDINSRDYIQIPQHNIVIAREIGYNGKNWHEALDALADDCLIMPRIDHFMAHFMNVRLAAKGIRTLLYADGTPVKQTDTNELWNCLSSTDRKNRENYWTWLDAFFKDEDGRLHLETNHRKGAQSNLYNLENHASTGLAGLDFNSQGLAKRPSGSDNYVQGENIYFWSPEDGTVARFDADSVRAFLYCDWYPTGRDSSLGVFPCAEGVAANLGGNQ